MKSEHAHRCDAVRHLSTLPRCRLWSSHARSRSHLLIALLFAVREKMSTSEVNDWRWRSELERKYEKCEDYKRKCRELCEKESLIADQEMMIVELQSQFGYRCDASSDHQQDHLREPHHKSDKLSPAKVSGSESERRRSPRQLSPFKSDSINCSHANPLLATSASNASFNSVAIAQDEDIITTILKLQEPKLRYRAVQQRALL